MKSTKDNGNIRLRMNPLEPEPHGIQAGELRARTAEHCQFSSLREAPPSARTDGLASEGLYKRLIPSWANVQESREPSWSRASSTAPEVMSRPSLEPLFSFLLPVAAILLQVPFGGQVARGVIFNRHAGTLACQESVDLRLNTH
jgi:hypothetical protein